MRRGRRGPIAPAAVLMLTAGPVTFPAGTVAAAADCTAGEVCVWPSTGYTGTVTVALDDLCHDGTVGSAVDGDSSPMQELRVYTRPGCAGSPTVIGPGAQEPSLAGQSYVNWHAPGA
jgi:Peptidase inhibitor family I36